MKDPWEAPNSAERDPWESSGPGWNADGTPDLSGVMGGPGEAAADYKPPTPVGKQPNVFDRFDPPSQSADQPQAPEYPGFLANSPDDSAAYSSLKNIATGAAKDAIGSVTGAGLEGIADYALAAMEHLATGRPVATISTELQHPWAFPP